MHEANIYIETDSAMFGKSLKKYGYVLECQINKGIETRHGIGEMEGTYHQVTLTALLEALERFNQSCEIHIYARDGYVLNMIKSKLHAWMANGFTTSTGKAIANQSEWIQVWHQVSKHLVFTEPGKHAYSDWLQTEMKRKENGVSN